MQRFQSIVIKDMTQLAKRRNVYFNLYVYKAHNLNKQLHADYTVIE